jgi:predicted secreted Zn-dependent protease
MYRGVSASARLLAFAGGLLTAWCGSANAEVRSNIDYSAYPVHGLTAQEIWRDIGRKGPHQPERGLYSQAAAQIRYSWEVAFESGRGMCRVLSATVYVDVNILIPDWADKARGSPALRAAWNEYIAEVRRHEDHPQGYRDGGCE